MPRSAILLAAILLSALAACDRRPSAGAPASPPPTHVDSVVPRAIALERFRTGLDTIDALAGGSPSRDALVRRFVVALERRDTTDLRTMQLTRGEFAWLYYPTNAQGLPPYDLSPDLMWFMLTENSRKGLAHALEERGGRRLGFVGYACDPQPSREGANTVYGPCVIRRAQARGQTTEERLFGLIIEREGRFKFVSYANRL
jgi:hypothetical protein